MISEFKQISETHNQIKETLETVTKVFETVMKRFIKHRQGMRHYQHKIAKRGKHR